MQIQLHDVQHHLIEQVLIDFILKINSFFKYLVEPTSSNDEEDDDESENETHIIPREILMVKTNS